MVRDRRISPGDLENMHLFLKTVEGSRKMIYYGVEATGYISRVMPWKELRVPSVKEKIKELEEHLIKSYTSLIDVVRLIYEEVHLAEGLPRPRRRRIEEDLPGFPDLAEVREDIKKYYPYPPEIREGLLRNILSDNYEILRRVDGVLHNLKYLKDFRTPWEFEKLGLGELPFLLDRTIGLLIISREKTLNLKSELDKAIGEN